MNSSFVSSRGICNGKIRLNASWPAAVIETAMPIVFVGSVGSITGRQSSRFVGVVRVSPEDLAEAESCVVVVNRRESLVEIHRRTHCDEHLAALSSLAILAIASKYSRSIWGA